MKKIIVFAMLLIISATSFSQLATPSQPSFRDYYLNKSKQQKTTGWIIFSSGVVLTTLYLSNSIVEIGYVGLLGVGMVFAGTTIFSVSLFNASVRNKEKGMSLSFKNETAPQIHQSSFVYKSVPSLTLKISL